MLIPCSELHGACICAVRVPTHECEANWGLILDAICSGESATRLPSPIRFEIVMVCVGEGEYPLLELANSMANGGVDYSIKNLWFKKGGELIKNPTRPLVDLEKLPLWDKELFENEVEIDRALRLNSRLIGINNRNLKTMVTDLAITEELAPAFPDDFLVVSESGLNSHKDLIRMSRVGCHCFLVGESLMRQDDVETATRNLLSPTHVTAVGN